ncbi:MAG: site-2 protease family protein [Nanoarchaeota archaeon]|nr:site-2 protease family protein [Nanoarchaeota archaeon]MBU1321030.1 site-2 protease family protein [Nanoarchaeota archaeon]MBU1598444.1 site-2 protease family protein [Nanoarchaeota archaeon]MBU2441370.1 site-2 protease family protein [Nanoarchaeota archaeon]
MLLSFAEFLDIIVMTLVVGFIFKDIFKPQPKVQVITPDYYLKQVKGTKLSNFWFAAAVVAPSIILHEFGHKFIAISQGMVATFQASYLGLGIGVVLKLFSPGFLFFIPAYVSIVGTGTPLQFSAIAFAGPAVNLILWLGGLLLMKFVKLKTNVHRFVFLMSRINMFLFIFNMLPIPGFDGFKVYSGLVSAFL